MDSEKEFLANYSQKDYERPSVTADVAAFTVSTGDRQASGDRGNKLRILLIKRGRHPFKGMWALPGGFLESSETVEECALREIQEETDVKPTALLPVGVFSKPGRDPRGWIISHAFATVLSGDAVKQTGMDDAADAQWFSVSFDREEDGTYRLSLRYGDTVIGAVLEEERTAFRRKEFRIVESNDIAFDHAAIISMAVTALRNEAADHEAVFDLLPEKFTLAGLRQVQETLISVSLLPGNLRNIVSSYAEETGEYETGDGDSNAKLYRRKNIDNT